MNKKIILLVAVLLAVAIVFVACKGIEINDGFSGMGSDLPGVIVDDDMSGEGVINIGGQEENNGEDTIEWNEIIGNNS